MDNLISSCSSVWNLGLGSNSHATGQSGVLGLRKGNEGCC